MYSVKLFFGLVVDEELSCHLNNVNPQLLALFIQNEENYLKEIHLENTRYLGKFIEKAVDLASLETLQLNIYSLLKRIVPDYPFEQTALILLPLKDTQCT